MRPARLLCVILLVSACASPALLAADVKPSDRSGALAAAWAACGGAPIQDGHEVQPTPARDKCLADKMHLPPLKPLNLEDVGTSVDSPVPPPGKLRPPSATAR